MQNKITTSSDRDRRHKYAGFSLLELIGVMTVTAILASVILPSVIRQVQLQAGKNESALLKRIGSALESHLKRNRAFPDESSWAHAAAAEMGVPVAEILDSPQQSPRIYVIDPALRIGSANGTLPFTQTSNGSIEPQSARVMILSSTDGTKPIPLSSGVIGAADFDTLWKLPDGSAPSGWSTKWQKSGEDLKVARIDLAPIFKKVLLNNYNSISPGRYSVNDGTQLFVPTQGIATFFVEGTVLGLHDNGGNLEARQILRKSSAFTYERETWRGQVHLGLKLSGDDIYNATTLFANSPQNLDAQAGATPSLVIDRFTDFMNQYVIWDNANFPGNGSQSYNSVIAAQNALGNTSGPLIYSLPPAPTVTIQLDRIESKKIKWNLTNSSPVNATIATLTLSWPGSTKLKRVKLGGMELLANVVLSSPAMIPTEEWESGIDRTIYAGGSTKTLEIHFTSEFPEAENQPASDFDLEVTFEQGGSVTF